MKPLINRSGGEVLDVFIDAVTWDEALSRIAEWSRRRESRYVCNCNVHSLASATRDVSFKNVLKQADLATPDGMPLAWALRRQGFTGQERIDGPNLMWRYCAVAEKTGEAVYLYGSTEATLISLSRNLLATYPKLNIVGSYAPPFTALSDTEEAMIVSLINDSKASVVFVGLGCPKQEKWMAQHRDQIHAVMIGVGAAFDFHAEKVHRAPPWMQRAGLEWVHRLISQPRRLMKRYIVSNSIFLFEVLKNFVF